MNQNINVGSKYCHVFKPLIEYSNDTDDIYENIDE